MTGPAACDRSIPWTSVRIDDPFWNPRLRTLAERTLASQWGQLHESGRLAMLGVWDGDGDPPPTHRYYDSDIAKWLEAVAYAQAWRPDEALRDNAGRVIAGYESIQEEDGYCNQSFIGVKHERWTDLWSAHELYSAGHLMEAAVAWHDAVGDDRLLRVTERLAEHIWQRFGPDGEHGVPGHPEIELALVRLAGACDEPRWRQLAKLFIDRRGTEPNWFADEAIRRGADAEKVAQRQWQSAQADLPVREVDTIEGHSVRALYLLAGMVDQAGDDPTLRDAAAAWWANAIDRRMYITGGFGSTRHGERFTHDYDLPNREAYAETCAAIAGALVARRWLSHRPNGRDGDVLERCLHNGMLAGMSLDGEHYHYANPLAAQLGIDPHEKDPRPLDTPHLARKAWYGCACCPPNVARVLASLGGYIADADDDGLDLHLPIGCRIDHAGWRLTVGGDYVKDGKVGIEISGAPPARRRLRLRLPAWRQSCAITVNGEPIEPANADGYAVIERDWLGGDRVACDFGIGARRCYADPRVPDSAQRVAVQRGPLIYCVEQCDHDAGVATLRIGDGTPITDEPLEGLPGAHAAALGVDGVAMRTDDLYGYDRPRPTETRLRLVPFAFWANRRVGDMQVWIARASGEGEQ